MVHPEHPTIESTILKNMLAPSGAFAIAFLFLVFQITYKMEFKCPCNTVNNQMFCIIYVFLPVVGLMIILTLPAKTCTIMCALCCSKRKCSSDGSSSQSRRVQSHSSCCTSWTCRRVLGKRVFRNMFLTSFWIITILIDGDALVCWTLTNENITEWYNQIPCKNEEKLTAEESKSLRHYQSLSQIIGLSSLFGIPIIWLLVSMIIQLCKTPYKSLFEDVYEEETITSAEVEMQKRVKISATKKCENVFNKYNNENFNWTNLSNELIDVITGEDTADLHRPSSTTPEPPLVTPEPSSATPEPSSATPEPPSVTPEPSSATPEPSSATPKPPSVTPEPHSATPEPPSATPEPPSVTPEPPSATPEHSSAKQPTSSSKSEGESRDRGSQSSTSVISAQIHQFK